MEGNIDNKIIKLEILYPNYSRRANRNIESDSSDNVAEVDWNYNVEKVPNAAEIYNDLKFSGFNNIHVEKEIVINGNKVMIDKKLDIGYSSSILGLGIWELISTRFFSIWYYCLLFLDLILVIQLFNCFSVFERTNFSYGLDNFQIMFLVLIGINFFISFFIRFIYAFNFNRIYFCDLLEKGWVIKDEQFKKF